MYIILIYDIITDENSSRTLNNVFKICKRYLSHVQKSVFEGELSQFEYMKMKSELSEYIRVDKDSVIVYIMRNKNWTEKEFLGIVEDKTSNFF